MKKYKITKKQKIAATAIAVAIFAYFSLPEMLVNPLLNLLFIAG